MLRLTLWAEFSHTVLAALTGAMFILGVSACDLRSRNAAAFTGPPGWTRRVALIYAVLVIITGDLRRG